MKILFLGPYKERMIEFLQSFNDEVLLHEKKLIPMQVIQSDYDFIISYGYRYIIPKEVVDFYKDRIINLHISYLPWNKGADPNLWSFLEETPKGITIHYIDEGIDTGDIIVQKEIFFTGRETLATSYKTLSDEIEILFKETWPKIRSKVHNRTPQTGQGSYHKLKDKNQYLYLLENGWDTPVCKLINQAKKEVQNEGNNG
nr:formyltransferase family protein [Neobacillus sp. Marseille-Q6967]